MDHYPESSISAIEIAVDFELVDGSSDTDQLMVLHGWFNHHLFPQRHVKLRTARRIRYDIAAKKHAVDPLATQGGDTTFQWRDSSQCLRVRLYRKEWDNGIQLQGQHPVRLEATLWRGACQGFDLHRIAELPQFADRMRRDLSNCFHIAEGIKPKLKRSRIHTPQKAQESAKGSEKEHLRVKRAWERYGSQWAARHGYATKPDTAANRAIGLALKQLREQMLSLKLTRKVAEMPSYEVLKRQQT